MPDPDKKVDETTTEETKTEVAPGETGEDGKYTDEGLAALVDQISKGETETKETSTEDKGAEETKETKTEKKEEQMVPISRLNEVISERNQLREKINTRPIATTEQTKVPTVEELRAEHKTKRQEWQTAVFENDQETATKLLNELDDLENSIDEARLNEVSDTTRAQSADDIRYDNLLESYKKKYPAIDNDSEDFDKGLVTKVFEVREAFIAAGNTWSQALEKAHELVLAPLGSTKKVEETTETRTTEGKRNLADALTRQPANVADVGSSADAVNNNKFGIDISRLTVDQFDKLPDEVKSKLRGDTLEEHHVANR